MVILCNSAIGHINVSLGSQPDENRLMEFYTNVAHFSLCYHMMWGLWGLVQANISKIEFDFVAFALGRLGEYFRVRDERLALKILKKSTV